MAAAVACDGCGKKFAWSPQFAGKKLKCKCGSVITIPADEPRAAAAAPPKQAAPPLPKKKAAPPPKPVTPRDEPRIEITEDEGPMLEIVEPVVAMAGGGAAVLACPSCNSPLSPGAILCVGCGYNLQLRRKMIAAPTKVVAGDSSGGDETDMAYRLREQIAPPILAVLGFIMLVAFMAAEQAALNAEWAAEFGDAEAEAVSIGGIVIYVGITTLISVFFMIIGCFVAAKLLDTNFGSLTTAPIKLAGILLITDGFTQMTTYFMGGMGGAFVDVTIGLILYIGLLMWLFELDGFEVWITAVIFWLVQWLGVLVFIMMMISFGVGLFAALGGGGGGGMTMPAGGGDVEMYDEGDFSDDEMMLDEDGEPIDPQGNVPQFQDPNAAPTEPTDPATDPAIDPGAEPAAPEAAPAPSDGSSDATGAWPRAGEARQLLAESTMPQMRARVRYRITPAAA